MSQLVIRIYKLSHTLRTKASLWKSTRFPSHRCTGKSERNIATNNSQWSSSEGRRLLEVLVLFVVRWILVKVAQCILVKSTEFENSYSLLKILLKSWLCCCSLAMLAPGQQSKVCSNRKLKERLPLAQLRNVSLLHPMLCLQVNWRRGVSCVGRWW